MHYNLYFACSDREQNVPVRVQVSSRGGGRYGGVTEGGRRGDNESFRRTRIGFPWLHGRQRSSDQRRSGACP